MSRFWPLPGIAVVAGMALLLAACGGSTPQNIATGKPGERLTSWLSTPEGDGPFPAVVLLHGCTGLERNTSHRTVWRGLRRHAALLNKNGYATLVVDSFGSRGITDGCRHPLKYYPLQVSDARDAFDHLSGLPFIDKERIGLVGLSLGGGTALRIAAAKDDNYSAFVAYYPYCDRSINPFKRPLLIMVGAKDDWTPARLCRNLEERLRQVFEAQDFELVVYPNAHHSFDLPITGVHSVEGHTVAQDHKARKDSQGRMLAFFDQYLSRH